MQRCKCETFSLPKILYQSLTSCLKHERNTASKYDFLIWLIAIILKSTKLAVKYTVDSLQLNIRIEVALSPIYMAFQKQ